MEKSMLAPGLGFEPHHSSAHREHSALLLRSIEHQSEGAPGYNRELRSTQLHSNLARCCHAAWSPRPLLRAGVLR